MFDLERTERNIIIALTATLFLGIIFSFYNKSHPPRKMEVGRFEVSDPALLAAPDVVKEKIDINTADVKELMRLRGVGEVLASRITEYRSSKGRFTSIEEIKRVRGIGPALYEKIKDRILAE